MRSNKSTCENHLGHANGAVTLHIAEYFGVCRVSLPAIRIHYKTEGIKIQDRAAGLVAVMKNSSGTFIHRTASRLGRQFRVNKKNSSNANGKAK